MAVIAEGDSRSNVPDVIVQRSQPYRLTIWPPITPTVQMTTMLFSGLTALGLNVSSVTINGGALVIAFSLR